MKETPVQQRVRLRLGDLGRPAWRNNVGACYDQTGRLIRYGLANDTAEMNKQMKSGDVITCNPILITQEMVGTVIGQFVSIECKRSDWHLTTGDEHGQAQLRWQQLVRRYGGAAGFANEADDVNRILRGEQ